MRQLLLLLILITGAGCALFMGTYDRNDSLERRVWWIETFISMNDKEGFHYSPLVLALDFDDYPVFEYFLAHGANVNDIDWNGIGAITVAAQKNKIEIAEKLLKLGANPALPRENPLTMACNLRYRYTPDGNIEMVKLLLKYKARINEEKGAFSPLMAAITCNIQIAELLIQNGADVNAYTTDGPVLFYSLIGVDTQPPVKTIAALNLLIKNRADINCVFKNREFGSGENVLERAIFYNAPPIIIAFLIKNGADINYVFKWEHYTADTLLDKAIFLKLPPERIALLRTYGAKTVEELRKEGKIPPKSKQ